MSFLNNIFGIKSSTQKENAYHKYAQSSTDEEKKIDSIIAFKNSKSLLELAKHNIKLNTQQVYDIMIGSGNPDDAFIYSFNSELMLYFTETNDQPIKVVLENLCQEIYTELKSNGYAVFSNGFAIAPRESANCYEKLQLLGNFLGNKGFSRMIAKDTAYASRICRFIQDMIEEIESSVEEIYANNRHLQSSSKGILEETLFYIKAPLRNIISNIYEEAQRIDVASIIDGLVGGKTSAQKNKILERLTEIIKNFDISELPEQAQETYNEIKSLISDLEPHREELQDESQLLYAKLTDERLPEILQQYIVLPKSFLRIYKDHEDSPQNLLVNALGSMQKAMEEIHRSFFGKRMLDLKATQLYMQQMTEGM